MGQIVKQRTRFVPESELKDDTPEEQWKDFIRADGRMPCVSCGEALDNHYQPVKLSCPTMVEDCEGNWWKL